MISEHFENAFRVGGGIRRTCVCGREHFDDSERAGDWEPGELEQLRKDADGEKVIASDDGVADLMCAGINYVQGCKCDALAKHEAFIWSHRRQIAEYLTERSKEMKRVAEFEHALLGDLDKKVAA